MLTLTFAIAAKAQRPRYDKMSSLVREACLASKMQTHNSRSAKANEDNATTKSNGYSSTAKSKGKTDTRRITAFVKADATASFDGCDILAQRGDLRIVSIPLNRLSWLSQQEGVARIEAGRRASTTMDTTRVIVGAEAVHNALSLPKSYTGRGVVVGVQDIGFDLTHPNFWSADMTRYRVKALWDQLSTDTVGSTLPAGRDYRDSLSLLTLGRPRDGDAQTHGTHTAGIAAGSGSEGTPQASAMGKYAGIAPDADLCFVCNATTDDKSLIDTADYYKYTYALDALGFKYIFDYADSVGQPCVINFSEGSHQDLWGDDILYYEMLDSLVGPGHILVASAGNEALKNTYVLKSEGLTSATLNAYGSGKTISFTTCSTADFSLRLKNTEGGLDRTYSLSDIAAADDSLLLDTVTVGAATYIIAAEAYPNCYDSSQTACDWVLMATKTVGNVGLTITGSDASVELFPVSVTISKTNATEEGVLVDNSHSLFSPGSAPCVVCVGSTSYRTQFINWRKQLMIYNHGTDGVRTTFSSIGPTFDGRIKPDVMAPGDNVISSYSSYYEEHNPNANDINSDVAHFTYNGRTYAWNSNAGTSMSSPVVAGCIALWLQANPRLTPDDCLDVIAQTSTHYDESLQYPNNLYGYGQIDAAAGLRLVLERATGIRQVSADKADNDRVYTIEGKYAGNSIDGLPKGVYIIKGKKVIIG